MQIIPFSSKSQNEQGVRFSRNFFMRISRLKLLDGQSEAWNKTLHKIAVRSYKQPFGGKNLKKRGLITDYFWDGYFK